MPSITFRWTTINISLSSYGIKQIFTILRSTNFFSSYLYPSFLPNLKLAQKCTSCVERNRLLNLKQILYNLCQVDLYVLLQNSSLLTLKSPPKMHIYRVLSKLIFANWVKIAVLLSRLLWSKKKRNVCQIIWRILLTHQIFRRLNILKLKGKVARDFLCIFCHEWNGEAGIGTYTGFKKFMLLLWFYIAILVC